jgi:hypothetical protein
MRNWTGLVTANGFFGVSVSVLLAVLYTADFRLMSLAFLASVLGPPSSPANPLILSSSR